MFKLEIKLQNMLEGVSQNLDIWILFWPLLLLPFRWTEKTTFIPNTNFFEESFLSHLISSSKNPINMFLVLYLGFRSFPVLWLLGQFSHLDEEAINKEVLVYYRKKCYLYQKFHIWSQHDNLGMYKEDCR